MPSLVGKKHLLPFTKNAENLLTVSFFEGIIAMDRKAIGAKMPANAFLLTED